MRELWSILPHPNATLSQETVKDCSLQWMLMSVFQYQLKLLELLTFVFQYKLKLFELLTVVSIIQYRSIKF